MGRLSGRLIFSERSAILETFNLRVTLEYMPLFLSCFLSTLWLPLS